MYIYVIHGSFRFDSQVQVSLSHLSAMSAIELVSHRLGYWIFNSNGIENFNSYIFQKLKMFSSWNIISILSIPYVVIMREIKETGSQNFVSHVGFVFSSQDQVRCLRESMRWSTRLSFCISILDKILIAFKEETITNDLLTYFILQNCKLSRKSAVY